MFYDKKSHLNRVIFELFFHFFHLSMSVAPKHVTHVLRRGYICSAPKHVIYDDSDNKYKKHRKNNGKKRRVPKHVKHGDSVNHLTK